MLKRQTILVLIAAAVVVLLGLLVSGAFRSREPEYEGKKLSEWVEILGAVWRGKQMLQEESAAQNAVLHIGTNAFPFLLAWMSYERPSWGAHLESALVRFLRSLSVNAKELRADGAEAAFFVLHEEAKQAVPQLARRMAEARGDQSSMRFAEVLGHLGKAGVAGLSAVITNDYSSARVKYQATVYVPGYTNFTPDVLRALRQLQKDQSFQVGISNLLRETEREQNRGHDLAP